jgi:hypothetical protein
MQHSYCSAQFFLGMMRDFAYFDVMPVVLESLNLAEAERKLCEEALRKGGSIVDAAVLLGITRHALKRRMIKHKIRWPGASGASSGGAAMSSQAA